MPKKVDFRETSSKRCSGVTLKGVHKPCHRMLKKNLLARKPAATKCWRCFQHSIGRVTHDDYRGTAVAD